jgi:hypothetical protein
MSLRTLLRVPARASGGRLLQPCFTGKGRDEKVREWSVDGIRKQIESAEGLTSRGPDSSQ